LAGWIGYRIFDDLLDNEGIVDLIPIGNASLRIVATSYIKLMPQVIHPLFHSIMNNLDAAQYSERTYRHIKNLSSLQDLYPVPLPIQHADYDTLAQKSLAHCLGPVTILAILGYGADHPYVQQTALFFYHYLIARQLNDNAHDWQADIHNGILTGVCCHVLQSWKNQAEQAFSEHACTGSLSQILPELQSIFWHKTIVKIAAEIQHHIHLAMEALDLLHIVTDKTYLMSLLTPLRISAEQALDERNRTLAFLARYQG
jgi:hypothetical protein